MNRADLIRAAQYAAGAADAATCAASFSNIKPGQEARFVQHARDGLNAALAALDEAAKPQPLHPIIAECFPHLAQGRAA